MGKPVAFFRVGNSRFEARVCDVCIAYALVDIPGHYIRVLYVNRMWRRRGVATALVRFANAQFPSKLNRCPSWFKNKAVKRISDQLGDEFGPEVD